MGRVTAGTSQLKKNDHCKLTDSKDDGWLGIFISSPSVYCFLGGSDPSE